MKTIAMLLLLVCGCANPQAQPQDPHNSPGSQDAGAEPSYSSAPVVVHKMINYDKLCTVVPVSATEFFTAKHCVILGQDHWIIEKDGTALLVDSFRISPDHDLALGVVDGVFDQYAVPSVELPMYGDPLELQGWSPTINSDEPRPAVWIGLDGGENSEDGQVFAWAAGAVYPGDSGGGMFYNGRLLAIIVAYSALRQPDGSENPAVVAVMLGFGADLF